MPALAEQPIDIPENAAEIPTRRTEATRRFIKPPSPLEARRSNRQFELKAIANVRVPDPRQPVRRGRICKGWNKRRAALCRVARVWRWTRALKKEPPAVRPGV